MENSVENSNKTNREKESLIRSISNEHENLKLYNTNIEQDKKKMQLEIERLRSHCIVLTEENHQYIEKLEELVEEDEKIRRGISVRHEQNLNVLYTNKFTLERSLNNLDEFLSKINLKKV